MQFSVGNPPSCFWAMGRNLRTKMKPTQKWLEHEKHHTDSKPSSGSNQGPKTSLLFLQTKLCLHMYPLIGPFQLMCLRVLPHTLCNLQGKSALRNSLSKWTLRNPSCMSDAQRVAYKCLSCIITSPLHPSTCGLNMGTFSYLCII